jgi:hypothetical protein
MEMAADINVLTSLSVPLIGLPALMAGVVPEETPLPAQIYELDSLATLMVLQIGLSLLGLFMAAVYMGLISLSLQDEEGRPAGMGAFLMMALRSTLRLVGLGLVFLAVLMMVWLPLLPIALLVGMLAGSMAIFVLLAGLVLVIMYLSLSVPAIVLNGRTVLQSVFESIRLVHSNAQQTITLLFAVILVGAVTSRLWQMADDGSWLTIVSIAGHAFISTALLAAIFVFYRDRWAFAHQEKVELNP